MRIASQKSTPRFYLYKICKNLGIPIEPISESDYVIIVRNQGE
jgi:hypothetical protein